MCWTPLYPQIIKNHNLNELTYFFYILNYKWNFNINVSDLPNPRFGLESDRILISKLDSDLDLVESRLHNKIRIR